MKPSSVINSVRVAHFDVNQYAKVAGFLRKEPTNGRRRSHARYIGSVYALDDEQHSVTFQDECLLPANDRGRLRLLLLVSNAHPQSIENGMFHTAESGVATLWTDLRAAKLFSGSETTLRSPERLRECCLNVDYEGPFCLGFACYWTFPTFRPRDLKDLFGLKYEPPGFSDTKERLHALIRDVKEKGGRIVGISAPSRACIPSSARREGEEASL